MKKGTYIYILQLEVFQISFFLFLLDKNQIDAWWSKDERIKKIVKFESSF